VNVSSYLRAVEPHAAHRVSRFTIEARSTCRPVSDRSADERRLQADLVGDEAREEETLANHLTAGRAERTTKLPVDE
jgi:hypothetical protein